MLYFESAHSCIQQLRFVIFLVLLLFLHFHKGADICLAGCVLLLWTAASNQKTEIGEEWNGRHGSKMSIPTQHNILERSPNRLNITEKW